MKKKKLRQQRKQVKRQKHKLKESDNKLKRLKGLREKLLRGLRENESKPKKLSA